jgi:hypothetical protein
MSTPAAHRRRLANVAAALPRSTSSSATTTSSAATTSSDDDGALPRVHLLNSAHLGGAQTAVHVLLPRSYDPSASPEAQRRYRVLYILPVVCGELDGVPAWGRPLDVARQHSFADTHDVIVAMATFPSLSARPNTLYVNHPSRADMQDEDYFCKDVVPLVDSLYLPAPANILCVIRISETGWSPHSERFSIYVGRSRYPTVAKPCGRFLTGFCASGNGATWMLLRHLDMFGKSAVWETWLDLSHMHPPDVAQVGSDENFQRYCSLRLIEEKAEQLRDGT